VSSKSRRIQPRHSQGSRNVVIVRQLQTLPTVQIRQVDSDEPGTRSSCANAALRCVQTQALTTASPARSRRSATRRARVETWAGRSPKGAHRAGVVLVLVTLYILVRPTSVTWRCRRWHDVFDLGGPPGVYCCVGFESPGTRGFWPADHHGFSLYDTVIVFDVETRIEQGEHPRLRNTPPAERFANRPTWRSNQTLSCRSDQHQPDLRALPIISADGGRRCGLLGSRPRLKDLALVPLVPRVIVGSYSSIFCHAARGCRLRERTDLVRTRTRWSVCSRRRALKARRRWRRMPTRRGGR